MKEAPLTVPSDSPPDILQGAAPENTDCEEGLYPPHNLPDADQRKRLVDTLLSAARSYAKWQESLSANSPSTDWDKGVYEGKAVDLGGILVIAVETIQCLERQVGRLSALYNFECGKSQMLIHELRKHAPVNELSVAPDKDSKYMTSVLGQLPKPRAWTPQDLTNQIPEDSGDTRHEVDSGDTVDKEP